MRSLQDTDGTLASIVDILHLENPLKFQLLSSLVGEETPQWKIDTWLRSVEVVAETSQSVVSGFTPRGLLQVLRQAVGISALAYRLPTGTLENAIPRVLRMLAARGLVVRLGELPAAATEEELWDGNDKRPSSGGGLSGLLSSLVNWTLGEQENEKEDFFTSIDFSRLSEEAQHTDFVTQKGLHQLVQNFLAAAPSLSSSLETVASDAPLLFLVKDVRSYFDSEVTAVAMPNYLWEHFLLTLKAHERVQLLRLTVAATEHKVVVVAFSENQSHGKQLSDANRAAILEAITLRMLTDQQKVFAEKQAAEEELAKQCAWQKKRKLALLHLRQVNLCQTEIAALEKLILTIHESQSSRDASWNLAVVQEALQTSANVKFSDEVLASLMESVDDMQGMADDNRCFSQEISQQLTQGETLEEDLEKEYERLVSDEAKRQRKVESLEQSAIRQMNRTMQATIPSPPNSLPTASAIRSPAEYPGRHRVSSPPVPVALSGVRHTRASEMMADAQRRRMLQRSSDSNLRSGSRWNQT